MFDALIVKRLKAPLGSAVRPLDRAGLTATQLTVIGAVVGLLAATAIMLDALITAAILFSLNRLFDGLDGALARVQGPTERGAFLDITCDFLVYSAIPLAFAIRDPDVALAAAFLLFSFVGTGSISGVLHFCCASSFGESGFERKSIYYLQGLTEGFETAVVSIVDVSDTSTGLNGLRGYLACCVW